MSIICSHLSLRSSRTMTLLIIFTRKLHLIQIIERLLELSNCQISISTLVIKRELQMNAIFQYAAEIMDQANGLVPRSQLENGVTISVISLTWQWRTCSTLLPRIKISFRLISSLGQVITQLIIFGTTLKKRLQSTQPTLQTLWKSLLVPTQRFKCTQSRVTMIHGQWTFKISQRSTVTGLSTISSRVGQIKLGWVRKKLKFSVNGDTTPSHLSSTQKVRWLVWTCRLVMILTGGFLMTELIQDSNCNG